MTLFLNVLEPDENIQMVSWWWGAQLNTETAEKIVVCNS